MAKYIYGIINSESKISFGNIGMSNGEIYSVQHEDLVALVSDVFDDCGIGVEESIIHDEALRKIMKPYSVIPMGFGTVAKDEREIQNILKRSRMRLKKTLERINNKLQVDVRILWDKAVLASILNDNFEIRKIAREVDENTDRASRIELGRKVKTALDEKRMEYMEDVELTLKSLSVDFEENKISHPDMLMNVALLIDKGEEQEVYNTLNKLEKKYANKLKFLVIAPLPPYNFTKIGIRKIAFDALEEARKTLCLSQEVSISEIDSAYNSLALRYHPDLHPDDSSSEKMFKKIRDARDLLTKYCEHYLCSLEKAETEENIIVEEKGS